MVWNWQNDWLLISVNLFCRMLSTGFRFKKKYSFAYISVMKISKLIFLAKYVTTNPVLNGAKSYVYTQFLHCVFCWGQRYVLNAFPSSKRRRSFWITLNLTLFQGQSQRRTLGGTGPHKNLIGHTCFVDFEFRVLLNVKIKTNV